MRTHGPCLWPSGMEMSGWFASVARCRCTGSSLERHGQLSDRVEQGRLSQKSQQHFIGRADCFSVLLGSEANPICTSPSGIKGRLALSLSVLPDSHRIGDRDFRYGTPAFNVRNKLFFRLHARGYLLGWYATEKSSNVSCIRPLPDSAKNCSTNCPARWESIR
jgi:hypothetical protein